VVALSSPVPYLDIKDILSLAKEKDESPFIIICDEIEDPHNLGALIRTAEAVGAHGLVIPKRRSVSVTPIVEKTSAGAASLLPIARVSNLASSIDRLKKEGIWVYCADMNGETWCDVNLSGAIALVIGSEGRGVGHLIKQKCDGIISIPMNGKINSLNASVAGGILMYEILRQRNYVKIKN
ncbi:MAG: 23S rRNA (guanosine(2251)-2'-O)-methyltransferase RlmB, partial [Oscillospiraceae bacterium]|nr:23S rRNA (guanosine(2251)-2'-O)-methyltransferase RlmB [Oscillospiraceae bacterium]